MRENDLNTLSEHVLAFCDARDWKQFHTPKDVAVALTVEAAELLERFRFKSDAECDAVLKDPEKREKIEEEVGDVLFYTLLFCGRNGIDPSAALLDKMRKNDEKYPVETSRGSNKKYNE